MCYILHRPKLRTRMYLMDARLRHLDPVARLAYPTGATADRFGRPPHASNTLQISALSTAVKPSFNSFYRLNCSTRTEKDSSRPHLFFMKDDRHGRCTKSTDNVLNLGQLALGRQDNGRPILSNQDCAYPRSECCIDVAICLR